MDDRRGFNVTSRWAFAPVGPTLRLALLWLNPFVDVPQRGVIQFVGLVDCHTLVVLDGRWGHQDTSASAQVSKQPKIRVQRRGFERDRQPRRLCSFLLCCAFCKFVAL